jgi:Fe-coproporphyrin III synthase
MMQMDVSAMIYVTKLLCGTQRAADVVRTEWMDPAGRVSDRKPVVVWNITRRCNLRCMRCSSDSAPRHYPGELTLEHMVDVIDDLSGSQVPAVILSGGDPMIHPHFFDVVGYAIERGLQVSVSTNGTRIDSHAAERLKDLGVAYVAISLDGVGRDHDHYRGRPGAFAKAVQAFRHCRGAGQKAILRLNLTRRTFGQLADIFRLVEEEEIPRICMYHLPGSGRRADAGFVPATETRQVMRMVADAVLRWGREGTPRQTLTFGQPADGVFFWLLMRRRDPKRAEAIWEDLKRNGGGGHALSNIDSQGDVRPWEFWQGRSLGNVKERSFSTIWKKSRKDKFFSGPADRLPHLKGRCARCRFQEICGGGSRARAFHKYGDPWAEDPGCYLRDYEIADS